MPSTVIDWIPVSEDSFIISTEYIFILPSSAVTLIFTTASWLVIDIFFVTVWITSSSSSNWTFAPSCVVSTYNGTLVKLALTNAVYLPLTATTSSPFTVTLFNVLSLETFSIFTVYCFSVPSCAITVTITCFDCTELKSIFNLSSPIEYSLFSIFTLAYALTVFTSNS